MDRVLNFPLAASANQAAPKATSSRTSASATSAARRNARRCTSDKFSPGNSNFGTTPFDYNLNQFEAMNPLEFNKGKMQPHAQTRSVHNAIWYVALGVLPSQRVFDPFKEANSSSVQCEHASRNFPLRGKTIQSVMEEVGSTFGFVEARPTFSLHDGDGTTQFLCNGSASVWLNDGLPMVNKYTLYLSPPPEEEPYIATGNPEETKWCKTLFRDWVLKIIQCNS